MELIKLKYILADENQPRKYFAADKMFQLRESIKKHGIKQPVIVEEIGKNKYLLIDGERRFRAATELKFDEIPAIVEQPSSETERLITQFNIQEQHEAWTPIEKAMSLLTLSKALGKNLNEVCKLLNVSTRDTRNYVAFAELADKENYVRNEVPLAYAEQIISLKGKVRRISRDHLNKEFNRSDEKKLEGQVVKQILKGAVLRKGDLTRVGDSFVKNPKLIEKFMSKDNVTPDSLFLEAKAAGAYHLRNLTYSARYVVSHGTQFLETRDVKLDDNQIEQFLKAEKVLKSIVALVR